MWLLLPILFYSLLYIYIRHVYSHWARKGYPTERTGVRWRFLKQVYRREFDYVNAISEAYITAGRLPFLGIYFFFRPTLLVRDIQLARTILEHTITHFGDAKWEHNVGSYRRINLLEKLTPMFGPRRLEGMFRNIEKVAEHLKRHLVITSGGPKSGEVDIQSVMKIYAINVLASLLYGVDTNLFDPTTDSIFATYAGKPMRGCLSFSYTLNHLPQRSTLTYRLRDIIKQGVERREDDGYIRKDILQLLVKYRNGNEVGVAANKENWHIDNVFVREKVFCVKKVAKIAESFLLMQMQTITSGIVFTLLEILQEPSILQKIEDEIRLLQKTEPRRQEDDRGLLSYEHVAGLTYLDACIQETFRKYPAMPIVERVCSRHFNIPHSRFVIGAGKTVMIPLLALQRDDRNFREPLRYWPERFIEGAASAEVFKETQKYMSYGLVSSTCVGQRFSKIVIKLALLKLLQNFHVDLAVPLVTSPPPLYHCPAPMIQSRDGLKVKLKERVIKPIFY